MSRTVRCERRRQLSIARLIAEHGRDGYDLQWLIAHDGPKMQNPTADIYDGFGVHFPELPHWFLSTQGQARVPA